GNTTSCCLGYSSPKAKSGPTVCPGVGASFSRVSVMSLLLGVEPGGVGPGDDDVPFVAHRELGHGEVVVVGADEPLALLLPRDGVVDRVERQQRVAREVHLRPEALGEAVAEDGEVDVRGPPGVDVVAPRVGAGLDGREVVAARSEER